jgi:hypothetical protein
MRVASIREGKAQRGQRAVALGRESERKRGLRWQEPMRRTRGW